MKRLKHGLGHGLGDIPPARSHHRVQMGQIQPAFQVKVLGAIWGEWPLSCGYHAKYGAASTAGLSTGPAKLQGGISCSEMRITAPAALRGLGTKVGSRNFPTGSSLCSSLLDIINTHPSMLAASWVALAAARACLYFTFYCGSLLPLSPRISLWPQQKWRWERGRTQEQTSPSSPPAGKPSKELEGKTNLVPWLPPTAGGGCQLTEMSTNNPEHPPVWLQWKERFFSGSVKITHPVDQKKWFFLNFCHPALSWWGLAAHCTGHY